jgi:hypothetical protein
VISIASTPSSRIELPARDPVEDAANAPHGQHKRRIDACGGLAAARFGNRQKMINE